MSKSIITIESILLSLVCSILLIVSGYSKIQVAEYDRQLAEVYQQSDEQRRSLEAAIQEIYVLQNDIASIETELAEEKETVVELRNVIAVMEEYSGVREILANLTPAEKTALLRLAMAEAGNQGVIGKALVMLTVINRVLTPGAYGNTIEGVVLSGAYTVTQPGGGYWTCVPDWECEVALYLLQHGWDESQGAKYFTNQGYSAYGDPLFQYKNHWFSG